MPDLTNRQILLVAYPEGEPKPSGGPWRVASAFRSAGKGTAQDRPGLGADFYLSRCAGHAGHDSIHRTAQYRQTTTR